MQGKIQIGSDISIKQRDFAGNVIDVFYSTGTIIQVTPFIYNEDNQDYILLKVSAERSSAIPGEITTEIKKTLVSTDLMMLSGDERVIGGLFINEEINVRQGIPILKDLPWWVFGIRYLTGYERKQITKKEVIILLHAELIPTIKERVVQKRENEIEKQILRDHEDLKKYKLKPFRENETKGIENK
jgi:type IV pilus assembly protein PilQ